MTALACVTLLVSGAGSPGLAEVSYARLGNLPCRYCGNCCSCSSDPAQHTALTPLRMDQAAQLPHPTTLRTVKSP